MNKLKKIFLTAVATLTVATVSAAGEEPAAESYRNNRHPLLQKDYIHCLSEPSAPKGGCTTN